MSTPCCGGNQISIWKNGMWECQACGAAKSNDPNYLYGTAGEQEYDTETFRKGFWGRKDTTVCECGAEKTYGPNASHASYCPKYVKP